MLIDHNLHSRRLRPRPPPDDATTHMLLLSLRRHYIGSRRVWSERAVVGNGRRKKERLAAIRQPAKMMTNFLRKATQNPEMCSTCTTLSFNSCLILLLQQLNFQKVSMTGVKLTGPWPCACGEIPKIGWRRDDDEDRQRHRRAGWGSRRV